MLEGLWSVDFILKPPLGMQGGGVVVFENQRVLGGDNNYYYKGSYEVQNDMVGMEIEVKFYGSEHAPSPSIFRPLTEFHIILSGKLSTMVMELQGYVVEDPNRKFPVRLAKRTGLP